MRRRKGTPFAEAIIGTWRGPEVCAYGRTLRTARSGGRLAKRSLGGSGGGRGLGIELRVNPRGSSETNRVRTPALLVSPAADASKWSSVLALLTLVARVAGEITDLVAGLKAQSQLVRTGHLPVLTELVADCVA